jgi:hypothetical protein
MKLIIDPHAIQQASERGVDVSMLFMDHLKQELENLLFGQKLVKTIKGSTLVFKKSNTSQTVYLKTAWASHSPINNTTFEGVKQC